MIYRRDYDVLGECFNHVFNFEDDFFETIVLQINEMVETLPEYILATPVHQKTIVKNLFDRIKTANRLIYDRIVQNNPTTVNDFNRCLLQVGCDAINCAKEHKTLIGSTNSPSHNPASTKKQKMSTSQYRTAVTGNSMAKVCYGCGLNANNQENNDVHTLSSTMRSM